ncbi:hypothetical protein FOA52_015578 [Chlamydomonas sp. UWO 241]|nr:hypothetical protein FOA52_015578 [Chlamydomonas sp. UWO 241]
MRSLNAKVKRRVGKGSVFALLVVLAVFVLAGFYAAASGRLLPLRAAWPHASTATASTQSSRVEQAAECRVQDEQSKTEYWGDVVKPGAGTSKKPGLTAASAQECCLECKEALGCNLWVYCSDAQQCGQQCWLKRVGRLDAIEGVKRSGGPWTSGILPKDFDRDVAMLPAVDQSLSIVALRTNHGAIRIQLKPEWSETSAEYLRRLAATPELCTSACQFYRAEPGFLLQGSMRAFIPPNSVTKPGPKFMERGDFGWAGGSAGPDFFIYLGTQPATHFGHDHTVFGVVADEESLQVAEKIVALPAEAPHPGDMHMLLETESFKFEIPAAA